MALKLTILGCGSATPTSQRNPTAQVLNVHERFFLIDCGEGTQIQMAKFAIKGHRINHIFISHLHGDHYLGLMGYLSSLHLVGRTAMMHIYCPAALQEILEVQWHHSGTELKYPITYHHLQPGENVILESNSLIVKSFPLKHRIPCWGFRFDEAPRSKNIIKGKIAEYDIPIEKIQGIKEGDDFVTETGDIIPNWELTQEQTPPKSYAFCSDTIYDEEIVPYIKEVDLLYHEATFMDNLAKRAEQTFHTTSIQAAQIAQKADVKKLLIGHFSSRYKETDGLLEEAKSVFGNTIAAYDGLSVEI